MISASSGFQTLLANSSRHFLAQIRKNGSVVDCDIKSIKIHKGACGDSTLTIGSVYSSYAELTVEGLTTLLENEDIEIRIGMTVSGSAEYITMGKFTVSKIKSTTYESFITAVGFISSKLAVDLPTLQSQTIPNIISGITSATGISISLSGLTNSGTITEPMTTMSCREALGLVTFLLGGYATETASGGIQISKYQIPSSKLAVNGNRMLSEPTFADSAFTMTGVKVIVSEESVDDEGTPIPEVSYETSTTVRQIYENKYMTQTLFNTFKNNVVGYTYMPGEVDLSLGDPRLEPWDCLAVTDLSSNTYNVPCLQVTHTFDGGLSTEVIAEGSSESDNGYEGSITKQLAQVNSEVIQAQDGASKASSAAASAQSSADAAALAASGAQSSADAAALAASAAQSDATAAKTAAASAQRSADSALVSLSTVEDVVGVLNWITAHGTMTSNGSAALDSSKVYFVRDNNGDYQVGSYKYSIVSEPKSSERTSYYTLSVDESVQNYVATHVAVNTEGLWLIPDQNGTPTTNGKKILIATGAGSSYTTAGTYIIDRSSGVDNVIASFRADGATIGENASGKARTEITPDSIYMVTDSGVPALSVSGSGLTQEIWTPTYITESVGLGYTYTYTFTGIANNTPVKFVISMMGGKNTAISLTIGQNSSGTAIDSLGVTLGTYSYNKTTNVITINADEDLYIQYYAVRSELVAPLIETAGSFTMGLDTVSNHLNQLAMGKYNVENDDYALMIGNGTADDARSNALTVDWNGSVIGQAMAGMVQMFAGSTAPTGWLMCDGSAVSRTTYAKLYAVIGTTYGSGNGSTTFNLPDMRGRVVVGSGTGTATDATAHSRGSTGGTETVTLTAAQSGVPAHSHGDTFKLHVVHPDNTGTLSTSQVVYGRPTGTEYTNANALSGSVSQNTASGASSAHNNMQPYVAMNYIICTGKTS